GPYPLLVWPPNTHVEQHPDDLARGDVRVAKLVELPGAYDEHLALGDIVALAIDLQHHRAARHVGDLDTLVAVFLEAPILRFRSVASANGQHLWQRSAERAARIFASGPCVQHDLARHRGF